MGTGFIGCALLAALMLFPLFCIIFRCISSVGWPKSEAVVLNSDPRNLRYVYFIKGTRLESNRISFDDFGDWKKDLNMLKSGCNLTIHHQPDNPWNSSVYVGLKSISFETSAVVLGGIAFFFIFATSGILILIRKNEIEPFVSSKKEEINHWLRPNI